MTDTDKDKLLASRISEIFLNGLVLNDNTKGFMESTFGEATPNNLEAVISDAENCERDSLLELIFFTDEMCQIKIEDMLTTERFTDQNKVILQLEKMIDHVEICFSRESGKLKVDFTRDLIEQFVSRLRIWNNPDKELEFAVRENVHPELIHRVLVKIRNADLPKSPHIIRFLCHFFAKMNSCEKDFFHYVNFLIPFSSEIYGTIDIFKALMERKKSCLQAIQKAEEYEKQLMKYNMEVMIMKGVRNQCINVEEVNKTVEIINQISFAMFGRSEYPDPVRQKIDLGVYDQDTDLKRVIKLLS
jgi:hypothetical protein